ncbi:hypothetical protein [Methanoculleus oceani]|nr:hypothetical protein [Methanoculleus sp. CWC-02]
MAQEIATPERSAEKAVSLTPMQRADELLQKMTIEEKAMQLSAATVGPPG